MQRRGEIVPAVPALQRQDGHVFRQRPRRAQRLGARDEIFLPAPRKEAAQHARREKRRHDERLLRRFRLALDGGERLFRDGDKPRLLRAPVQQPAHRGFGIFFVPRAGRDGEGVPQRLRLGPGAVDLCVDVQLVRIREVCAGREDAHRALIPVLKAQAEHFRVQAAPARRDGGEEVARRAVVVALLHEEPERLPALEFLPRSRVVRDVQRAQHRADRFLVGGVHHSRAARKAEAAGRRHQIDQIRPVHASPPLTRAATQSPRP